MKKEEIKYIKLKIKPVAAQVIFQNWVIDKKVSNAGFISIELSRHIRKFLKELQEIPLSEELQSYD